MSRPGTRPWSRKILKSVSEGMTPDWKISSPTMLPKGWTADLMYSTVQYSTLQYRCTIDGGPDVGLHQPRVAGPGLEQQLSPPRPGSFEV